MKLMKPFFCLAIIYMTYTANLHAGKTYKIDINPLQKHPKMSERFSSLQSKFQSQPLTKSEHQERIKILDSVLQQEKQWWDGYWLLASESFILGSSIEDLENNPEARQILESGKKAAETCLNFQPKHLLCRFFDASLQAKIASIDGVFASLRYGKRIESIWAEVAESDINMNFRPNVSLLGSALYGLGLFYRLVPDNFLVEWIWGIRGNKEKSVEFHRRALSYDKSNPCSLLMYAVSLLCLAGENKNQSGFTEAMTVLDKVEQIVPIDSPQALCQQETAKIRQTPSKTCGYTQAKYQQQEESD